MGDQISSSPSTQARRRLIHRGRASEEGGGGGGGDDSDRERTGRGNHRGGRGERSETAYRYWRVECRSQGEEGISLSAAQLRNTEGERASESLNRREREREQHKPSV